MIELDLDFSLGGFRLRVDARLEAGVTAIMGPSGAGKTTLLEAVAGLRPEARGRIVVDGLLMLDTGRGVCLPPEERGVGYVPQDIGLFPHLTALQNIRFGIAGVTVAALVEMLEIGHVLERYPRSLSGGEKQRVALARALATAPRLLLLDEPLAAIDIALKERILPYVRRLQNEIQVPIFYVTHNVGEALSLAHHVLVLKEGALEAQGAPADLLTAPTLSHDAEMGIENLFRGHVLSHDEPGGVTRVALEGGLEISVPFAGQRAPGTEVTLAILAEDVLVSVRPIEGLSARNVFSARVEKFTAMTHDATLQCSVERHTGVWMVRVTPAAVRDLGLTPGRQVWVAVKSHSIRVF